MIALITRPPTLIPSINRLLALIVALVLKVLAATRRIEATAPADIALYLLGVARRQLIPLDARERGVLRQQCSGQELRWGLGHTGLGERLEARLRHHARAVVLRRHLLEHARAVGHLLLAVPAAFFLRFFLEQRADADAASFRAEMAAESVGAGEASPAAPVVAVFEVAAADELLLAGVQAFVALAVVLARECLAAHAADEGALVCVRAQMRPEVVGAGEALRTQSTLEGCWVLLCTLGI